MNARPSAPQAVLAYRPDIDGLRAVAVLAVVLYHAFSVFPRGGFVGVDVFFVISGFLITSIILKGLSRGGGQSYDFLDFYVRRVRRIFPALILVLLTVLAGGLLLFTPEELQHLGKHITGGAGYVSNLVLWSEAGYFDRSSAVKPLLHLWSLGIEEQFYLIWPLLLFLASRLRLNRLSVVSLLLLASLATGVVTLRKDPVSAFYLPWNRFWELALGAWLACCWEQYPELGPAISRRAGTWLARVTAEGGRVADPAAWWRGFLSLLGLALIVFSALRIRDDFAFPGWWALCPTLGAALIIAAGPTAWLNRRLLSPRPMVWLGLVSYPLYLWHWPLLSFARTIWGETPPLWLRLTLVLISLILAWLTYALVEPRLRRGPHARAKALALFISLCLVGGLGYYCYQAQGLPERLVSKEEAERDKKAKADFKADQGRCHRFFPDIAMGHCAMQDSPEKIKIALIGDSHSRHLYWGLAETLVDKDAPIAMFYLWPCSSYEGVCATKEKMKDIEKIKVIANELGQAYEFVVKEKNLDVVILSFSVAGIFNGAYDMTNLAETDRDKIVEAGMRRSLDKLSQAGKRVIIVFDSPRLSIDPQKCSSDRPIHLLRPSGCVMDRKTASQRKALVWYAGLVNKVIKNYSNISVFNIFDALCDEKSCPIIKDGRLLYTDSNHLSYAGSRLVAKKLLESIEDK